MKIKVIFTVFLAVIVFASQATVGEQEEVSGVLISKGERVKEVEILTQNIIWEMTGFSHVEDADRLDNGNTLITDYLLNTVIEVDKAKTIVWQFSSLDGPFDAERLTNGNTLIADGNNGRVLEVDPAGNIVWTYLLNTVIEVDKAKTIVWQFSSLDGPFDAERLTNGNTLIADGNNGRVLEVDPAGNIVCIVWTLTGVGRPLDVERLSNGNTLITYQHGRIIEVDSDKNIVWTFENGYVEPIDAERLINGNTLITYHSGSHVIEVDHSGNILWDISTFYHPASAKRLPNGDTLIAVHAGYYSGVVSVDTNGNIVWTVDATPYSTGPMDADPICIQAVPTIESSNIFGIKKDIFQPGESVYAIGCGYAASTTYDLYVVEDTPWSDGMSIPARVSGTESSVTTDTSENSPTGTLIWASSLVGKYDIVVDVNGNGQYDAGTDALDSNIDVGFEVIPEFSTIAIPVASILGLLFFFNHRKRRKEQ